MERQELYAHNIPRLQESYERLARLCDRLPDSPSCLVGEPTFERMVKGMDWVQETEGYLRDAGFKGCIFGEGNSCPENSPMICDGCVEAASKKQEVFTW